ncbi:MAG TPA: glycosyltransferase family protein [Gemmatimonadaceae bacterium]|nr:glycosyltransferase family protein [Gemmatimonadaceae bacterium]
MNTLGVVTVIQARVGSSRLPGKVLLPLGGTTVLQRQIERVRAATRVGTVVVATTTDRADDPIVALCEQTRTVCVRGHPTDLLARHCLAASTFDARVVTKIPSDCPLIDPRVIDDVLAFFLERPDLDYASNLHPPTEPDGFDVEVFSRTALDLANREAAQPHEREHTTPFLWDQPDRFRLGNVRRADGRDYATSHRVVLDYAPDYDVIRAVFDALHPANPLFTVDDVIAWLDAHPALAALNHTYRGLSWYQNHLDALRTLRPGAPFAAATA